MDENINDDIGLDDAMLELGINEDDLVVVNKDGSYVVIPLELADILMSDPEFVAKVDSGFEDIDDFSSLVTELYNNIATDEDANGEDDDNDD